jgi:hypothetical protein
VAHDEDAEGDAVTARIYTAAEAEALLAGTTPGPWRTYGNAAHDDAPSDAWSIAHDGITLAEAHADDRPQYDEDAAEVVEADADLMAAAPDLAASVAFHARRAEKAEADLTVADDRASDAEAESAAAEAALVAVWQAITDDDLPRLPVGDGTVVDAEAVGRRVAALVSQRDTANADFVVAADGGKHLARQVEHLEGEVARLTSALTAQTARADGAEATELRRRQERDALRAIIEGRTTPPTDAEARAHAAAGGLWRAFHYSPGMEAHFDHLDAIGARKTATVLRERGLHATWWALDSQRRPCVWPVVTEVTP